MENLESKCQESISMQQCYFGNVANIHLSNSIENKDMYSTDCNDSINSNGIDFAAQKDDVRLFATEYTTVWSVFS